MDQIIDLTRYPLDHRDSAAYTGLVAACRADLAANGLFNLPGFLRDDARSRAVAALKPLFDQHAFTHARRHNIYFKPDVADLPANHPALTKMETVNHTLCSDQLAATDLHRLYTWPPFAAFLADVMQQDQLYPMADPLAGLNAMAYRDREALNWHFDRSEFTTTLLLQAPDAGGAFEYAKDLRSDEDPNYDGVAALLTGEIPAIVMPLTAGTLNVFKGRNTAHRVTPVQGATPRIITVFSYYDRAGVQFSEAERVGFYGRAI